MILARGAPRVHSERTMTNTNSDRPRSEMAVNPSAKCHGRYANFGHVCLRARAWDGVFGPLGPACERWAVKARLAR